MKNSVWTWPYSTRYYLTHPWKWFRELFRNIKDMWHRSIYGWTWVDVWNLDDWMLGVLPDMLRHMADHGNGYPGIEPFGTELKWHDWLHYMANTLESLRVNYWYAKNEYAERFHKMSDLARKIKQTHPNLTVTYDFDTQELKNLSILYFQRSKELTEQREKLLEETGRELFKYLPLLWD